MEIVRDLGEFGLLERVVSKYCSSARLGHFEDANLVRVKDIWLVNNTDSMPNHLPMPSVFHTEERDMFYEAGWTAVITTLNDLAVSGAQNYMSFSTRPIF
ncbi:MAG: AIR synthase related protein, partial [Candidatus Nanoarchaeia archaeon]